MHATESLLKLFNEWEIQLLVLLSFTLQLFLFFAGSLRRHSSSGFLKLSNWIAYLGADFVAVYALGLLSKQDQDERRETKALAFFWAPFLLMHLGGQDTITAFSMEDNNLWLRHLLNLVVQVVLALYVFWKSIGRGLHNVEFLVSGIFVFISGIIKYGERIWSLKYSASVKTVGRSTVDHYTTRWLNLGESGGGGYSGVVHDALQFMPYVRAIFSSRPIKIVRDRCFLRHRTPEYRSKIQKMIRFELGVMYDDLYTKAIVLRARSGIILRCISQVSALVAFALFNVSQDTWRSSSSYGYSKVDIAITYSLFIGGFFLEFCTMVIFMMSPWTWVWLKARKWHRLARLSWFILTSNIGWPEKKQRWPHSMGQYNFWSISTDSDQQKTCSERVMKGVINFYVNLVGPTNENRFWMSQLLDTKYVGVDKKVVECVTEEIMVLYLEFQGESQRPREWHHLNALLNWHKNVLVADFGQAIIDMHLTTGLLLSKHPPNNSTATTESATPPPAAAAAAAADDDDDNVFINSMVEVCRKLSNYMMHLLVSKPSMLPLTVSAEATLEDYQPRGLQSILNRCANLPGPGKEALEEMVCMWTRLLVYAAGKSTVEFHVAELSRGGELITFAWLLMAYCGLGDSMRRNISIINAEGGPGVDELTYAFHVPTSENCPPSTGAATSLLSEITGTPFTRHG